MSSVIETKEYVVNCFTLASGAKMVLSDIYARYVFTLRVGGVSFHILLPCDSWVELIWVFMATSPF